MSEHDQPFVTADADAGSSLLVKAGGTWSINGRLPAYEEICARVGQLPKNGVLRFDLSEVSGWDSSLVSFVAQLIKESQAKEIRVETSGMPEGVQRLLKTALAVPEKNTQPAPDNELFFTRLGRAGITLGAGIWEVFAFLGLAALAFGRLVRGRSAFRWGDAWLIIQRCGAEALPIVTLINFLVGMILGFVSGVQLEKFGATLYMATLVGIAMARELGGLMTGIIMSGRTGAAFAAELGSMKVSQEIDALKTLGLSPMEFLVLPRLMALILMMPLLTVYGNLMGMAGGAVLAPTFGVSLAQYYRQLTISVDLPNYAAGIIKSGFFGAVVAGAGCLKGMESGNSAAAVGLSTTSAVVTAITTIIALDAVFAFVLTALGI